jgi:beta-mannosidase
MRASHSHHAFLQRYGIAAAVVCVVFSVLPLTSACGQVRSISIDRGWQFHQLPGDATPAAPVVSGWLPAIVPGDVHLDLLAQKLIPDPFFGTNEAKLQWIGDTDWEYRTQIPMPPSTLQSRHIDLVFEGLDAYARVYLNDVLVLTADNQFRTWRVDAKPVLKAGDNTLRVVFPAQDKAAQTIAGKDPWFGRNSVAAKSYIRKAAYEHGWDWGPAFVTVGIWKPVRLELWTRTRIEDFHIQQTDVSASSAHLAAEVELQSDRTESVALTIASAAPDGTAALPRITQRFQLHAGSNHLLVPLQMEHPHLWFPAGYGEQPLYRFTATVSDNGSPQVRRLRIGIRSLQLRRDPDRWGRSFEFVVNGIPIFAKGADVIPSDSFANRVTSEKYRAMLQSAKDANMNMVRLWGGGYYEADEFYDLCDELGIMIWHDFMFGNDWQPGAYDFEQGVEKEAEDQLRRLRNHPSIVVWCGNNETEEAFHWHDRDKLPGEDRLRMWQDYLTLFHGVLARSVARFDPEVPYWPSSPSADFEATSADYASGDQHLWDVWHGRVPFSTYETHHPRFVSEYGFQSFPDLRTIETFTTPEDRASIFTPVMLAHQKNDEGNALIHDYMLRDYPEPKDFPSFLYASQVLQAEGIKLGAEHFRRERPRTMGSIFWQLNDCWPVASWSSIDSTGRWKALQFYAKRFYAPVLVSPHVEDGTVQVYIVSDRTAVERGTLHVQRMRFDGTVLSDKTLPVEIEPLSSKSFYSLSLSDLGTAGEDLTKSFVVSTLTVDNEPDSRNVLYLAPTKQIELPVAHVSVTVEPAAGGAMLQIHADTLARSVEVTSDDPSATFDDNFLDVLPGETRSLHIKSALPLASIRSGLHLRSLSDAFDQR